MEPLLVYLFLINAAAFALMHADKRRAKKKKWRISEKTLLATAVLGGSFGCLLSMQIFRHKTRHIKFSIGIPLLLALQIMMAVILLSLF